MSKRILGTLTAIALIASLSFGLPARAEGSVCLSSQSLTIDGKTAVCTKYNIDGSNYFKLRDIAYLLNGTGSEFGVNLEVSVGSKNSTISITTGTAYTADGSELKTGSDESSTAVASGMALSVDGSAVSGISAYNIGGNTYFKLRDLGDMLGFVVSFDPASNAATVNSTTTVKVTTAKDFLNAVATGTRIVLAAGTYDLSTVDKTTVTNKNATYSDVYDGQEIIFSNIKNCIVCGAGTGSTSLVIEPRYANVLNFSGCTNITVKKLTAGHTTAQGECVGGVLRFLGGTQNVTVKSCELYGCGTYGVVSDNAGNIAVSDTVIRNCTYGAVSATDTAGLSFNSCSLHDCAAYALIDLMKCSDVLFSSCKIFNNKASSPYYSFLSFVDCNNVTFKSCSFTDNSMYSLLDLDNCQGVALTDNVFTGNTISGDIYYKGSDKNATITPAIS